MDSLAAPQDRLVEQLLSPRTQAQRRLKVCVKGVECGSVCVRPLGPGPMALGCDRGWQGKGPQGVGAGPARGGGSALLSINSPCSTIAAASHPRGWMGATWGLPPPGTLREG